MEMTMQVIVGIVILLIVAGVLLYIFVKHIQAPDDALDKQTQNIEKCSDPLDPECESLWKKENQEGSPAPVDNPS